MEHEVRFDRTSDAQMSEIERRHLYQLVIDHKPYKLYEVGFWKGGGSSYINCSSIAKNGFGHLHTVEYNKDFYDQAVALYEGELSYLKQYITPHFGDSRVVYKEMIDNGEIDKVDFLFLDGADDAQITLDEYNLFLPFFHKGTVLAIHDFKTKKALYVKEYLTEENGWKDLFSLDTLTGFNAYIRL